MTKKVLITTKLTKEAYKMTSIQIINLIREEAKIPWCNEIENVSIEDNEATYQNLKKQGISNNIAQSIIKLYTE